MSDAVTGLWARTANDDTCGKWLRTASWLSGACIALESVGVPYATQLAEECGVLVLIALARAEKSS